MSSLDKSIWSLKKSWALNLKSWGLVAITIGLGSILAWPLDELREAHKKKTPNSINTTDTTDTAQKPWTPKYWVKDSKNIEFKWVFKPVEMEEDNTYVDAANIKKN